MTGKELKKPETTIELAGKTYRLEMDMLALADLEEHFGGLDAFESKIQEFFVMLESGNFDKPCLRDSIAMLFAMTHNVEGQEDITEKEIVKALSADREGRNKAFTAIWSAWTAALPSGDEKNAENPPETQNSRG